MCLNVVKAAAPKVLGLPKNMRVVNEKDHLSNNHLSNKTPEENQSSTRTKEDKL